MGLLPSSMSVLISSPTWSTHICAASSSDTHTLDSNMFKSLFAATAAITCCLGNPALASVGDAFDTATHQSKGGCYQTGGHSVCWQTIKPATYTIALRESNNRPEYATTLLLTCGGKWKPLVLLPNQLCKLLQMPSVKSKATKQPGPPVGDLTLRVLQIHI